MPMDDRLRYNQNNPFDSVDAILKEIDREGLIRLLDYILQKQVQNKPLTALELHRHFLESTKGSKIVIALGEKKILQKLEQMEIIRLRKPMGKIMISCMELTDKGNNCLNKLRNYT